MKDLSSRFWSKVDKGAPEECWLWRGTRIKSGYGHFRLSQTKVSPAHRVAYELEIGPIGDLYVCHRCDVRACVNPGHLFLGTHLDNMRDMIDKGRKVLVYGERHHRARLTDREVAEIRDLRAAGATRLSLCERFGAPLGTIKDILGRKTRNAIGSEIDAETHAKAVQRLSGVRPSVRGQGSIFDLMKGA